MTSNSYCSQCGSPLQPGARFCSSCGCGTAEAVTPEPIASTSLELEDELTKEAEKPKTKGISWLRLVMGGVALVLLMCIGLVIHQLYIDLSNEGGDDGDDSDYEYAEENGIRNEPSKPSNEGGDDGDDSDYEYAEENGIRNEPSKPSNAQDAEYFYNRAQNHQVTGNYDQAIKDYTSAINLDPSNVIYYYSRGCLYKGKGMIAYLNKHDSYDELIKIGIKDFNKCLQIDSDGLNGVVFCELGNAYACLSNTQAALDFYKTALKHDENNPYILSSLGRFLLATGSTVGGAGALGLCRRALMIDPESEDALYLRDMLRQKGLWR